MTSEPLASRRAEELALAELLDSTRDEPAVVVIEGDAGIGKTTMWRDALHHAAERGFRVLSARGVAAESVLAYNALGDLLGTVDESVWADLPEPQRQGLDAALLRHRDLGGDTDARAVAAAFLAVITKLATLGPVVVAIDDFQWLDISSANTVLFVARRLPAGVALLCTTRSEDAATQLRLASSGAVRRVQLQPLTVGELHQVLASRLGGSFARPTLLRIHEIAGGNPFYAVELAREISTWPSGTRVGLPGSLADLVRTRIGRVSPNADDALLAMASLADPTVQLVAQATHTAPDRLMELLEEAEAFAVIAIEGNRVRFAHPLLAHAVYSSATPGRRRAMHRRLAAIVTEPELRARHLALSVTTGEPQTVQALDDAAELALSRGAAAAAAELLELAIGLGADTAERHIRCARCHFAAGDPQRARQLLEESIEESAPGPLRGEALHQLALVRFYDDSFVEAAELLERGLRECGDDVALRVRILVGLSFARVNGGQPYDALQRAHEAVADADRYGTADLLSQALGMRAMLEFMSGQGFDEPAIRRAVELEERDPSTPLAFRPSVQMALLLAWTGELDIAREHMAEVHSRCSSHGEEAELIFTAFHLVVIDIWRGDLQQAGVLAEETMQRAAQLGGDFPLFVALTIRATIATHAGRTTDARRDLDDAIAASRRCGSLRLADWTSTVHCFLEVSLGNYRAALTAIEAVLPAVSAWPAATEVISASFIPDAVEAMIGLGRLDDAEPLIDALERNGRRLDRRWMLAVGARCRAMLLAARGDLDAATATAERAMTEHGRLPMPFERARTQLLLGQLHRRQRHRGAATTTLREALNTFERLGTTLWADRVRAELARGISGRRRGVGLTPSERRVAQLAASGMSNRDIAATLFISPKTVEVNLSRIYRKLNIHSRIELYRTFESSTESEPLKE